MRRTLFENSSRGTLSVPNFNVVPGALGEFECRQFCVHQIFFELLQPLRKICQRIVRIFLSLFEFLFWVLGNRNWFLEPFRHLALWLFLPLFSTSPVWRCRGRNASRIGGYPWNDKKYEIVCFSDNTLRIFGQPWLLTAGPLIGVSVVFAKLA